MSKTVQRQVWTSRIYISLVDEIVARKLKQGEMRSDEVITEIMKLLVFINGDIYFGFNNNVSKQNFEAAIGCPF